MSWERNAVGSALHAMPVVVDSRLAGSSSAVLYEPRFGRAIASERQIFAARISR